MLWPIREKNTIRIRRNNPTIIRWMFNVRPEEYCKRISVESKIGMVWSPSTGRTSVVSDNLTKKKIME